MKVPEWLKKGLEWLKKGLGWGAVIGGDVAAAYAGAKLADRGTDPRKAAAQVVGDLLREQIAFNREDLEEGLAYIDAQLMGAGLQSGSSAIKKLIEELNEKGPLRIGGHLYMENELSGWIAKFVRVGRKDKLLRLERVCAISREKFVAEYELDHNDGMVQHFRLAQKVVEEFDAKCGANAKKLEREVKKWAKREKVKAARPSRKTPVDRVLENPLRIVPWILFGRRP